MPEEEKEKKEEGYKVVLSGQAREYVDKLLEEGKKEEFMEITDAFKEISKNPMKGQPIVMQHDEVTMGQIRSYVGQQVIGVCDTASAGTNVLFGDGAIRIIHAELENGKEIACFDAELENQTPEDDDIKATDTFLEDAAHDGERYILTFGVRDKDYKIIVRTVGAGVIEPPPRSKEEE